MSTNSLHHLMYVKMTISFYEKVDVVLCVWVVHTQQPKLKMCVRKPKLEMPASCRVAGPPQMTCRLPTCRHVVKMSGMSA